KAGTQFRPWIPAFAGMTRKGMAAPSTRRWGSRTEIRCPTQLVIPAEARIHPAVDTGFRRHDKEGTAASGGRLLGRLGDDQLAVVIDREPGLAGRLDDAWVPIDLAGVGAADHGDQRRLGIVAR